MRRRPFPSATLGQRTSFDPRQRQRLQRWPVLLAVTVRPELPPPWTRFPHVTLLLLNRLGRNDTTALIDSVAGGRSLPASVIDAILTRTEGVPPFAEELTKAILESDLLRETADGLELTGPLAQLAIPNTLHDSLMARLERLGFFATLTKRRLKRGVFRSIVDLQAAINRYLDEANHDPKPFIWTADPDKIIAAVNRGRQALESIH